MNGEVKSKLIPIGLSVTLLLTIAGWGYSAGVLSQQVKNNKEILDERRGNVGKIPVIANEVNDIKNKVSNNSNTLQRIETEQTVQKEILKRIEKKLDR